MDAIDFISFLKDFVLATKIDLSLEPPQASVFSHRAVRYEGDIQEALTIEYPHLCLADDPSEMWSVLVRMKMAEHPDCEGALFWCVVENPENGRDNVFFFIYTKETNELKSYLANIFLNEVKEVELAEVLPDMVDDYDAEPVAH